MTQPMPPKWHVTSQNLTTSISDSSAGFESVWEVRFTVDDGPAKGHAALVRIPAAQYNAATVKAAIDALTYHMSSVAGL